MLDAALCRVLTSAMANDTPDPTAFIREMFAQFAAGGTAGGTGGEGGGDKQSPDDPWRVFGTASTGFKPMIDRALAAANIPGRGELEDLTARISRIEAALFRIEARLTEAGGNTDNS